MLNTMTKGVSALTLLAVLVGGVSMATAAVTLQSGQKQLFLDDYVVDEMAGLTRTMHAPQKMGAVIKPDTNGDGYMAQGRSAPMWVASEQLYKIIYLAYHSRSTPLSVTNQPGPALAISSDGVTWQKPSLGYINIRGSTDNNRINVSGSWPTNALENVLYDGGETDGTRRYKGFVGAVGRQPNISSDGVNWTELAVGAIPSGDEAQLVQDGAQGRFLAMVKLGDATGRTVGLSTSSDFESWTTPTQIFAVDQTDQRQARDVIKARIADDTLWQPLFVDPEPDPCYVPAPGSLSTWTCDVYNMAVFPYEGVYIGLPAVFYRTGLDYNGNNTDGFHHIQLTMSRDLNTWQRLGDRQPFIGPSRIDGGLLGVYDRTQLLPTSQPIRRGDQLWFYYSGLKWRDCKYLHNLDGSPRPAEDLSPEEAADFADGDGAICLAVLRLDGFVSLDAGATEGTLTTKTLNVTGSALYLNADAGGGAVRVEVLDAAGQPIPGFTRNDCQAITVDSVRTAVSWTTGDWATLAGQNVKLKFYVTDAKLYAFGVNIPAADTGEVTLFKDDFENTGSVSNAAYPDGSGDYDPDNPTVGTWSVAETAEAMSQVSRYSGPGQPPAAHSGANYLIGGYNYHQDGSWHSYGLPAAVISPTAQVSIDAWFYGSSDYMAGFIAVYDDDYSDVPVLLKLDAATGAVQYFSGGWQGADLSWTTGAWNHLVLDIDCTAGAAQLTINDQGPLSIGMYDAATHVGNVRFYSDYAGYYDDITITTGSATPALVTLIVASEPAFVNTISPSLGGHDYVENMPVVVTAQRYANCPEVYVFDHWEGDVLNSTAAATLVVADSNKTVTAVYVSDPQCGDECHPHPRPDIHPDCRVDQMDFAVLSAQWLDCSAPECD